MAIPTSQFIPPPLIPLATIRIFSTFSKSIPRHTQRRTTHPSSAWAWPPWLPGHWGNFLLSLPVWFHSEGCQNPRLKSTALITCLSPWSLLHTPLFRAHWPPRQAGSSRGLCPCPPRAHPQGLSSGVSLRLPPLLMLQNLTPAPAYLPSSFLPYFLICTFPSAHSGLFSRLWVFSFLPLD